MTASTPSPADSGAAASRDAARTARRLTDGTLPRTSPPQGAPPGTPPPTRQDTPAEPVRDGESGETGAAPTPNGDGAPHSATDSAPHPAQHSVADSAVGGEAGSTSAGAPAPAPADGPDSVSAAPPAPAAGTPAPVAVTPSPAAGSSAPAPVVSAPAAPGVPAVPHGAGEPEPPRGRVPVWPEPGASGGGGSAPADTGSSSTGTWPATDPSGRAGTSPGHDRGSVGTSPGHVQGPVGAQPVHPSGSSGTRPGQSAAAVGGATTGPSTGSGPAPVSPAPAVRTGPPEPGPSGTRHVSPEGPAGTASARPGGSPSGPAGTRPGDPASSAAPLPVRPVGSVSGTASGASAVPGAAPKSPAVAGRPEPSGGTSTIPRVQPVAPAYPGTRQAGATGSSGAPSAPAPAPVPSSTGKHARPAATAAPAPSASPSSPKASTPAVTVRSGGPAPVPVAVATPTAAPGAAPGSSPDRPAPRGDTPDFGRIAGAGVGSVAVPVAGVVRVARRKNVIGSETTGSIPVHLLFRDEPGTARRPAAGEDDGGPDTVAMAAPAIPGPSKVQAVPGAESPTNGTPKSASGPAHAKGTVKAPAKTPVKTLDNGTGKATARASAKATAAVSASRPAPTADPALVERPAPVLPGWVGVVGGALALAACAAVVWWAGAVPQEASRMLRLPERPYNGIHLGQWAMLALGVVLVLFALGGLGRGRVGYAWVLTLFGDYRGTVRRTGLVWVSPLLLRRRVDVRLRHWRSEPLSAVDAKGTALDVVVLVVWRVRDTVRAALGVDGHEDYLREQVEAAMARVLSQLPADAFHEDAPTLRDAEAVGEALTRMLSAECAPVGVDVFSAQPTRIEYAPEVAAAMTRRRIAAIDAKHRDSVLTSVVDAVDDVVHRLTSRGLVELDDYERKALVKDLTVAFYTGRTGPVEGA